MTDTDRAFKSPQLPGYSHGPDLALQVRSLFGWCKSAQLGLRCDVSFERQSHFYLSVCMVIPSQRDT